MGLVFVAMLVVSGAPKQPAGPGGFQDTRWGMSPAQVQKLYPQAVSAAVAGAPETKDNLKATVAVSDESLPAYFRFTDGRLCNVGVDVFDWLAASNAEEAAMQRSMDAQSAAVKAQSAASDAFAERTKKESDDLTAKIKRAKTDDELNALTRASAAQDAVATREADAIDARGTEQLASAKATGEAEVTRLRRQAITQRVAQFTKFRDALASKYGQPKIETEGLSLASTDDELATALAHKAFARATWTMQANIISLTLGDYDHLQYEDPKCVAHAAAAERKRAAVEAVKAAKGL